MIQPTTPKPPKPPAKSVVPQNARPVRTAGTANEAFDKEVDEELQREWVSRLWEHYSGYILAGALAFVLAVGAYKLIESRRQAAAEAQGAAYATAVKLLTSGKVDEGTQALAAVSKNGGGFGAVARLRLAAADAATGKTADAVAKYEALANDRALDPVLADFARLQTAMLTLDNANWDDFRGKLSTLTADGNAWRHSARELLGLAAMKAGKLDEARTQFEKLIGDQGTPPGIAERARIMMGSIVAADMAAKAPPAPVTAPAAVAPAPPATPATGAPKKK